MRFTLKNPRSLQYIDYQNVRKTEFLGCQSQEIYRRYMRKCVSKSLKMAHKIADYEKND